MALLDVRSFYGEQEALSDPCEKEMRDAKKQGESTIYDKCLDWSHGYHQALIHSAKHTSLLYQIKSKYFQVANLSFLGKTPLFILYSCLKEPFG